MKSYSLMSRHRRRQQVTPALLHTTCTAPNCSTEAARQRVRCCVVADIGGHVNVLTLQASDLLRGSLQCGFLDVVQDHIEPGSGEALGQYETDTVGAPVTTAPFP